MSYEQTAVFLKALAHPTRLQIIDQLKDVDELCVCHIYEALGLEQSNISQHLKLLRDQKILATRKEGLKVFYRIHDSRILNIIELISKIGENHAD